MTNNPNMPPDDQNPRGFEYVDGDEVIEAEIVDDEEFIDDGEAAGGETFDEPDPMHNPFYHVRESRSSEFDPSTGMGWRAVDWQRQRRMRPLRVFGGRRSYAISDGLPQPDPTETVTFNRHEYIRDIRRKRRVRMAAALGLAAATGFLAAALTRAADNKNRIVIHVDEPGPHIDTSPKVISYPATEEEQRAADTVPFGVTTTVPEPSVELAPGSSLLGILQSEAGCANGLTEASRLEITRAVYGGLPEIARANRRGINNSDVYMPSKPIKIPKSIFDQLVERSECSGTASTTMAPTTTLFASASAPSQAVTETSVEAADSITQPSADGIIYTG